MKRWSHAWDALSSCHAYSNFRSKSWQDSLPGKHPNHAERLERWIRWFGVSHPNPLDEEQVQEREVRVAAQRVLTHQLCPGPSANQPPDTFWPDIDIDLAGATLIDFDLYGAPVRTATWSARFTGDADFESARFTDRAGFESANFAARYTNFKSATFIGKAHFSGSATFAGYANFDAANFNTKVYFIAATFNGGATFSETAFATAPNLQSATFATGVPIELKPFVPASGDDPHVSGESKQ